MDKNERTATQAVECQERLYNGTVCRKPAVTTVAMDFTEERKPVCRRHAR